MKMINLVSAILLIVAGLNWGLVGFFEMNLIATVFGDSTTAARAVYALAGLSAVYQILHFKRFCGCATTAA